MITICLSIIRHLKIWRKEELQLLKNPQLWENRAVGREHHKNKRRWRKSSRWKRLINSGMRTSNVFCVWLRWLWLLCFVGANQYRQSLGSTAAVLRIGVFWFFIVLLAVRYYIGVWEMSRRSKISKCVSDSEWWEVTFNSSKACWWS